VIEGLGRNGQPERANKVFEEMLERLSVDTSAAALASARRTGWRSRQADASTQRDARLFDAYLRAGLLYISCPVFMTDTFLWFFQLLPRSFCSPTY